MIDQTDDFMEYPADGKYLYFLTDEQFVFLLKKYVELDYESEYVDFKKERPKKLVDTIGAMANTNSGIIVFGIEQKAKNFWKGVSNIDDLENTISNIQSDSIRPFFDLKFRTLEIDLKKYLVVAIPKINEEVLAGGRYYFRVNRRNYPIKSPEERERQQRKKENNKSGFLVFERLKKDLLAFRLEEDIKSSKEKDLSQIEKYFSFLERITEKPETTNIIRIISLLNQIKLKSSQTTLEKNTAIFQRVKTRAMIFFLALPLLSAFISFLLLAFIFRTIISTSYIHLDDISRLSYLFIFLILFISFTFAFIALKVTFVKDLSLTNHRSYIEEMEEDIVYVNVEKIYELLHIKQNRLVLSYIHDAIAEMRYNLSKINIRREEGDSYVYSRINPNFDPFKPQGEFRKWLELNETKDLITILDNKTQIDRIRLFTFDLMYSRLLLNQNRRMKLISSDFNKKQDEVTELLTMNDKELYDILLIDQYYYIYRLEKSLSR